MKCQIYPKTFFACSSSPKTGITEKKTSRPLELKTLPGTRSRFIFILSFFDSYIISFIKLSNCFISKTKITAILFLLFLEPELQLCQAENSRIDLKTCISFQMRLLGSAPMFYDSTKELTCEIECHMGANGYPGGKLYHSAQAGGQTDLIASSN